MLVLMGIVFFLSDVIIYFHRIVLQTEIAVLNLRKEFLRSFHTVIESHQILGIKYPVSFFER